MPTANRSFSKKPRSDTNPTGGAPRELRPLVEWLTSVGVTDHWVISCYLKLEPRDRARGKYLIKLKNRIKARLAWLDEHEPDRARHEGASRDLDRVREYLEHSGSQVEGRGIAIFACEALDVFEVIPLPHVFRSRLVVDRSPLVRELVALDDEFGLVFCTAFDRTSARFFKVTASGVQELEGLSAIGATRPGKFVGQGSPAGSGHNPGVGGEHNYHRRIKEEKHRHLAQIAQRLFELTRGGGARGVVLASAGSETGALIAHLHPYVSQSVLGTTKMNPKSVAEAEVLEAVLEVRSRSERAAEADDVSSLKEGIVTGWAVNGLAGTLEALARGRVRTLLVDPMAEQVGVRCRETGRLALAGSDCDTEGGGDPIPDVVDEAIEETLRQGGHIDVVEDDGLRAKIDGVAALLRFVVP